MAFQGRMIRKSGLLRNLAAQAVIIVAFLSSGVAQAKDGVLWDIGLSYAIPSYPSNPDRSAATAVAVDLGAFWSLAEGSRLGGAIHALADRYEYIEADTLTDVSVTLNQILVGPSFRQSFGADNHGFFVRADAGMVLTSASLTIDDVEYEADGESGFGFLARAGYGLTASGDFNIAPQVTFAGHSVGEDFNTSIEIGASFSF